MSSQYTISLLGTAITVRTEEDLQYIKQLEGRVAKALQEVQEDLGLVDPLSVALMASLFIADENFKLKRQAPSSSLTGYDKAEGALAQLEKLLDKAIENNTGT